MLELSFIHRGERPRVGRDDFVARREAGVASRAREAHVPGTDVLTHVAAEQPVTDLCRLRLGKFTAVLDRQIRNASARVEIARPSEGLGRTGVQAAPAGAAAVRVEWEIGLEVGIGQDDADECEGADLRVNQHHVLADPAEPSELRELPLGHRPRVDVTTGQGAGSQEPDRRGELFETLAQNVVVIG